MPIDAAPHTPPSIERRLRELELLRSVAVETAASVEPGEIWAAVCRRLPELAEADVALLVLPGEEPREWWADPDAPRDDIPALLERLEAARRTGRTAVSEGAVAAPMRPRGEHAALLVGWADGEVPPGGAALVEALAEQTSVALAGAARYAEMRDAALRRDRFFSAMSHDLRTPITAIVGYSELLQDGIVGDLTERQLEMVERICQVSGHLSQLVNDILDLARLDAGRMEFHLQPKDLGELLDDALAAVEPQAAAKGLEVRVDGPSEVQVVVDSTRVRQILVNLLSNAVRFTESGAVCVSAGQDGDRGWIEVRDTGPGLPGGSEEAVFEEFLQLAPAGKGKREPGTGLGLAIARRLARAMGGDLAARNVDGSGAAFTLYLASHRDTEAQR
jgi:signal transduction histidine kinase